MKAFVEEQDASGKIDDSYNAMVADRDEVSRIIREENNRLTKVIIILQVTFASHFRGHANSCSTLITEMYQFHKEKVEG